MSTSRRANEVSSSSYSSASSSRASPSRRRALSVASYSASTVSSSGCAASDSCPATASHGSGRSPRVARLLALASFHSSSQRRIWADRNGSRRRATSPSGYRVRSATAVRLVTTARTGRPCSASRCWKRATRTRKSLWWTPVVCRSSSKPSRSSTGTAPPAERTSSGQDTRSPVAVRTACSSCSWRSSSARTSRRGTRTGRKPADGRRAARTRVSTDLPAPGWPSTSSGESAAPGEVRAPAR